MTKRLLHDNVSKNMTMGQSARKSAILAVVTSTNDEVSRSTFQPMHKLVPLQVEGDACMQCITALLARRAWKMCKKTKKTDNFREASDDARGNRANLHFLSNRNCPYPLQLGHRASGCRQRAQARPHRLAS